MLFDYDDRDPLSILKYSDGFKGKTFTEILNMYENSPVKVYENHYEYGQDIINKEIQDAEGKYEISEKAKGQLGNILEKCGYGYKPNGIQEADFPKAGVELKLSCLDTRIKGDFSAGERLSITNISYREEVIDDFYKSHVWNKIKLILLVQYIRDKNVQKIDNVIKFINLFTPPEKDLEIIINDYYAINEKLKKGLAHEISEGDTLYLGACTKGASAEKSLQSQFYSEIPAKKRNFCLKRSYMQYVLDEYVIKGNVPFKLPDEEFYRTSKILSKGKQGENIYESVIQENEIENLKNCSFENIILNKIVVNYGFSAKELASKYECNYVPSNKSMWSNLAFRMLGIKGNHAEEFKKASIVVKTVRINEKNKINEHMSLPAFEFNELVNQDWEKSEVYNYLSETKFLLIIYKKKGNDIFLEKALFWNMPIEDLETTVKLGWINVKKSIIKGVTFTYKQSKKGITVYNSLPNSVDNKIIHVRPHTSNAAYMLNDGYIHGNIKKDASVLPNGELMTRQSFWINKNYIHEILKNAK